jgi:restriction system protein
MFNGGSNMSDHKTMWMVRAGRDAHLFDEFKSKEIVAIGWNETGDLSKLSTPGEIKQMVREKYPDYKLGKLNISASQISRFRFDFKKGDKVITYNPEKRIYLVGEILGDCEYNTKICEYFHIRKVKWLGEIPRDKLSASSKNTLGAISTIFKLTEEAEEEIIKLLKNKEEPEEDTENEDAELDTIKEDMLAKAREFIKDKVLKLDWEEAQEIVAGLLRSMGYKTTISPKGPDRGQDIQASPDGLGLEDPKIIVQVKHRSGSVDRKEITSFTGGLRQGSKGLYVSTGGFSKDAKYEAERSTIPITLIDLDMLVELIIQYYDNFDAEARALIPLVKIYWPA